MSIVEAGIQVPASAVHRVYLPEQGEMVRKRIVVAALVILTGAAAFLLGLAGPDISEFD